MLRILIDSLFSIIIVCNKEGDLLFYCLVKVIFDSMGDLERMNIFEGYFEYLVKELNCLRRFDKLMLEDVWDFFLKINGSWENFLYILVCWYGVGYCVIKNLLWNIELDIMVIF